MGVTGTEDDYVDTFQRIAKVNIRARESPSAPLLVQNAILQLAIGNKEEAKKAADQMRRRFPSSPIVRAEADHIECVAFGLEEW